MKGRYYDGEETNEKVIVGDRPLRGSEDLQNLPLNT